MSAKTDDDLKGDLEYLASSLEGLSVADTADHRRLIARRDWVVRTIREYLIPRVADPAAPLIVVFAGPTGAGKSTLLNSVIGSDHSPAGPLRPTTKGPVVLASTAKADRYQEIAGVTCEVSTGKAPILDELILVDTPDIDSTSTEHRATAETMIDNADIVIFVNSALRYSDQVPWEVLRRAHSRGVPVIQVMNRIRVSSRGALADYSHRLEAEGLGSDVVAVQEQHIPRGAQSIPSAAVQDLRDRLVGEIEARRAGATDVVRSVLDTTLDQARQLVDEAVEMLEAADAAPDLAGDLLTADLDRILDRRDPRPGGGLDLRPLLELERRRLRTRGMVRRRTPDPSDVARSIVLFDEALIAGIDADIRRQLHAGHLVHGNDRKQILSDAHLSARSAVSAWRGEIDGIPGVAGSADLPLVSLLISIASLEPDQRRLDPVIALLAHGLDIPATLTRARDSLVGHLRPIYEGVEYRVASRTAGVTATRRSIDRVKASRWAVIARSTFSDA